MNHLGCEGVLFIYIKLSWKQRQMKAGMHLKKCTISNILPVKRFKGC